MKKTSKILSVILAILMVISINPITASAETIEGTWGENITWIFNEATGVLTISGYGEISGSKTWSSYSEDIKEIIIEEGITTIPNSAFYSCRALVSVKLPDSVSIINPYAFFFCTSLESVYMGIGVKTIGEYAFNLCFKLKNVYYSGTKTQWNAISFGESNSYITSGPTFYYNSVGDSGHAHIYETVVTTPATCTENGLGSVVCTICGFSYPTKLTALGHTNVVVPAVLPTTTAPGHTRIETCSVCDEVILEGKVVPILNETSYTTKSGDYLISVLDQSTDTLTVYGTGTIEYGHELDLFYYEPRNQKVHFNVDTLIITDGITGIGNDAFAYHPVISVVIADSVKTIGAEAFYGCEVLNSVEMGDGVTSIGDSAFANCYNLKEFTIGKSVETIGINAFQTCENLEGFIVDSENTHFSVDENGILYNGDKTELILCPQGSKVANYEMPSSVKEIRAGAFYKCKYLAHAVICDGVTTIPEEAFYRCENLESVVIPKSVTEIGEGAFDYWCGLSIVYYGGTEEEWKELTKSFTLLEGNNDSLIMATVYYNYEKLESASGVCGENLTWTFDADTATLTISGTGEMTEYGYDSDFPWYSYAKDIKKVIISDGVTSISSYAFEGFTGLTSVEIADSVTTIGEYSFAFCDSLKSITLPDSVTLIGKGVFSDCMNLSSVKLSKGLTVIPNSAFAYCINLVDITISDNIVEIGNAAFCGCKSLENITLSKNITAINGGTFAECYSLKAIDIPDGVTIIYEYAFDYCIDLETVKIGKGVKTIQKRSFYECHYLKNVYYAGGEHDWNSIDIGLFNGWLTRNEIHFAEAPGHSYTSEITTPATHTENGVITYTCSCGDSYTEAIEILEKHNYESVVTEPTCTEQGYTTYTCVCGDSYVADYVDATGHNYSSEITTPATHTTTGIMTYTCTCGDTYTETIEKIEKHNYEAVVTAPTCTEQGYTTYTCECGYTYADDYVAALGHTEETIHAIAPTCTETGVTEGAKCSVCGETLTEQKELPANGHTPANTVEEKYITPTCTENGSKDVVVYCSVCDEEISRETIILEATGHADNSGDGYCDVDNEVLDPSVECDCNCHKSGVSNFFFKFILFFQRLFGSNKECACGVAHY